MTDTTTSLRLTDDEKRSWNENGYVVRTGVFGDDDIKTLADASEQICGDLVAQRAGTGKRRASGSYVFQPDATNHLIIKWERDADTLLGLEPFAHLHEVFQTFAADPRFTEPMKDLVGTEDVVLWTEKLNLKRAEVGQAIPPHQDFPYWKDAAGDVDHIVTAMLNLDDATIASGCLEVVPGSHTDGLLAMRTDDPGAALEMDPESYDDAHTVPVEVPKGSVLFFGPLLAHRSAPNRSKNDRRTVLYSYQPAGNAHILEYFAKIGL
jgi:ectoine hydroxylase-related dioxygenase (phytanoyl-CoA dioxygenase family)